jgi:hypothetical protein
LFAEEDEERRMGRGPNSRDPDASEFASATANSFTTAAGLSRINTPAFASAPVHTVSAAVGPGATSVSAEVGWAGSRVSSSGASPEGSAAPSRRLSLLGIERLLMTAADPAAAARGGRPTPEHRSLMPTPEQGSPLSIGPSPMPGPGRRRRDPSAEPDPDAQPGLAEC